MSDKRPVVVYGASGFSAPADHRVPARVQRPVRRRRARTARRSRRSSRTCRASARPTTRSSRSTTTSTRSRRCSRAPRSSATRVGPCIYYGSTVAEAALKAGCHYIDTGGETPWVRLAHEEWGAKFAEAGLLLAPATAYMSAVAEACARIAIERAPGIDSLEILSMFMGFPTYGSTQTIFGQLQWESIYLEQNEYKEWPPVTTLEVTIPSAITTQLALPWGGFPHPVWFKDHPQIANVRAFGGLLDRSLMEGIVAGQRDYQEKIKPLPAGGAACGARRDRRLDAARAAAAREPAPAAHRRRRRRARQPRDGPGVRARPGRLPPDRPDPGVRRAPPRPRSRRARSASPRRARPSATGSCSGRSRPTGSSGSRSAS